MTDRGSLIALGLTLIHSFFGEGKMDDRCVNNPIRSFWQDLDQKYMEKLEIFESPKKNFLWAIFTFAVGLFFVVVSFSEGTSQGEQIFSVGIGIAFILGSILFVQSAQSMAPIVIISDEGMWTADFDKMVLWNDIESIKIEDDSMVVELVNVEKSFPDRSKISRALLKRSFVDLSRTNVQIPHLFKVLEERWGRQ